MTRLTTVALAIVLLLPVFATGARANLDPMLISGMEEGGRLPVTAPRLGFEREGGQRAIDEGASEVGGWMLVEPSSELEGFIDREFLGKGDQHEVRPVLQMLFHPVGLIAHAAGRHELGDRPG